MDELEALEILKRKNLTVTESEEEKKKKEEYLKYKEDLIDENIIWDAVKYGIMAPSAHNRQPWKVKLVKKS